MAHEKILVVEDETEIAHLIQLFLRKTGYTVTALAESGEAALQAADRLLPDLVLMDIELAGALDGVETAELLHHRFSVPVVFLTGLSDDATLRRSRSADAFGYLLKPFRAEQLTAAIETALNKHKVESRLRKIENWFSAALTSIGDGVIATDLAGEVTFLNPVAENLTGWTLGETPGKNLREIFHVLCPNAGPALESPITRALREGGACHFPRQTRLRARSGREVPIEASAAPIKNSQGQAIGAVLIFRDISERREAEEKLAEREARLRAIYDSEPECVKLLAADGALLEMNHAGLAMIEADSMAQVAGRCIYPLIQPRYRDDFRRLTENVFRGEGGRMEFEITGLKGAHRWLETNAAPLRNNQGQVVAALGITRDVTERKLAEQALSQSREQLRSLAAHLQSVREEERTRIAREIHDELGQMLTGFKMDVAWLDKRLAAAPPPLLDKVKTMSGLIDDMVKSVRRISAELRPGVLDDLGLVAALEWQAREFQVRTGIQCRFAPALGELELSADLGTAIFRICQETLTNVARHAQATSVRIDLGAIDRQIALTVQDDGRGITDEEMARAKSFGLVGMRERTTILGGAFQISGTPGRGTTVTVTIPLPASAGL